MRLRKWLLYITNNEDDPLHEKEFDVAFFLINTVALIVGSYLLIEKDMAEWIAFLVIEYTWAVDTMRHNRP